MKLMTIRPIAGSTMSLYIFDDGVEYIHAGELQIEIGYSPRSSALRTLDRFGLEKTASRTTRRPWRAFTVEFRLCRPGSRSTTVAPSPLSGRRTTRDALIAPSTSSKHRSTRSRFKAT
jgi:hypothetical protein